MRKMKFIEFGGPACITHSGIREALFMTKHGERGLDDAYYSTRWTINGQMTLIILVPSEWHFPATEISYGRQGTEVLGTTVASLRGMRSLQLTYSGTDPC